MDVVVAPPELAPPPSIYTYIACSDSTSTMAGDTQTSTHARATTSLAWRPYVPTSFVNPTRSRLGWCIWRRTDEQRRCMLGGRSSDVDTSLHHRRRRPVRSNDELASVNVPTRRIALQAPSHSLLPRLDVGRLASVRPYIDITL
ncbi:hypothetical protein SCHPADRAFT_758958 [Schizopora paradoxa]|uniref:Uncharacterized protein n=1 Tax=Schizopora paradoxa TaxID=27342 RepID=A0A0H2QXV4_9AGAM|nr:hypothetical protein SCHPADRAFT_758958 [Schizopora paradoxa]